MYLIPGILWQVQKYKIKLFQMSNQKTWQSNYHGKISANYNSTLINVPKPCLLVWIKVIPVSVIHCPCSAWLYPVIFLFWPLWAHSSGKTAIVPCETLFPFIVLSVSNTNHETVTAGPSNMFWLPRYIVTWF
jgi:hypothetical protein